MRIIDQPFIMAVMMGWEYPTPEETREIARQLYNYQVPLPKVTWPMAAKEGV